MIAFQYILAPIIGGVIGYITNDVAIRMLFRPHEAKYLFGFKIPFTPGIIPKEKGRIAKSIGGAISDNLMSKDVLEKNLLSEDMINKISSSIIDFIELQKSNQETIQNFLLHYITENDLSNMKNSIKDNLSLQISHSLEKISIGDEIADIVVKHVASKLRVEGLNIDIPQMLRNLVGNRLWENIASSIEKPTKNFLSQNINQMLKDKGPEMINNTIKKEIDIFLDVKVQDLLVGKDEQINEFVDFVIGLYRTIITEHLPKILETINIPAIIESRINEMDMEETEKLILQVMNKELRAIVWLGALLGMIMGSVNIFL